MPPTRSSSYRRRWALSLWLGLLLFAAMDAHAWTPDSQTTLARHAVRISPRDFSKQLLKHEREFLRGVMAPFNDRDAGLHQRNQVGGRLDEVIALEVKRTIEAIRSHKTFRDIAYQAGVLVHYINDANNPLNCSDADPDEGGYYADFLSYMESTSPRLALIFYGLEQALEERNVGAFVAHSLERCRAQYPKVGSEYKRIGKLPGSRYFDDRSTAFGVSAVSHSRALTDAALILRYVWIEAGGADWRSPPRSDQDRLLVVPRADR